MTREEALAILDRISRRDGVHYTLTGTNKIDPGLGGCIWSVSLEEMRKAGLYVFSQMEKCLLIT